MTMMLDILADYLDMEEIKFCRLDGRMNLEERGKCMDIFKNDPSVPVFLVSTRAGGLGINLTSADTVIIYDSDWVISETASLIDIYKAVLKMTMNGPGL